MNDNQTDKQAVRDCVQKARLYQKNAQYSEALQVATQAVKADPSSGDAWECLGFILLSRKQWRQARSVLELGVQADPLHVGLLSYYALTLTKAGETRAAWRYAKRAMALAPRTAEVVLAAVEVLSDAGYCDMALRESEALLEANMAQATNFMRGALLFQTGECARGMALLASVLNDGWDGPEVGEWRGESAKGKHVAFFCKQGFGDFIQFARYLPLATARIDAALLVTPPALERLMRDSFPDLPLLVTPPTSPQAFERPHQTQFLDWPMGVTQKCALTSLPSCLGETFEALPQSVPYLRPNPTLAAEWRERIAALPRPRIGLVWSSPLTLNNPARVITLEGLRPVLGIARCHLVSFEREPAQVELMRAEGIYDASPFIHDFADSAALMSELDLIISLDSGPAHLAGALGRPVWVFLPFCGEWRWMIGREDSIWYPSMRLFCQEEPAQWGPVMERMATALGRFLAGDLSVLSPSVWDGPALRRHPHAIDLDGVANVFAVDEPFR